jgi:type II secretory ATPase GspE/PulE/Tfp pilus assembly ATPase PilB-like protein
VKKLDSLHKQQRVLRVDDPLEPLVEEIRQTSLHMRSHNTLK